MTTATLQEPISVIMDDELYEVIDGKRVGLPPMGLFAVWIASDLYAYLAPFVRTQKLGRAITEALFHLPAPINRDRRPDVAFVSYQRWAKDRPMPRKSNAWDVVPNLATEVVSPTDSAEELDDKIAEYFRAGVQLVWVVYPMQSKIHVYSSPTQIAVLTRADVLDGGAVVPGFKLPLAELFTEPAETAAEANGAAPMK
jgi:Uma2 family endonuclease